jgi:hypothetical protein
VVLTVGIFPEQVRPQPQPAGHRSGASASLAASPSYRSQQAMALGQATLYRPHCSTSRAEWRVRAHAFGPELRVLIGFVEERSRQAAASGVGGIADNTDRGDAARIGDLHGLGLSALRARRRHRISPRFAGSVGSSDSQPAPSRTENGQNVARLPYERPIGTELAPGEDG